MTSPAHMMRGHSCCAETLHPVVVDETCLLEGCHCLINLLVSSCDVPANTKTKNNEPLITLPWKAIKKKMHHGFAGQFNSDSFNPPGENTWSQWGQNFPLNRKKLPIKATSVQIGSLTNAELLKSISETSTVYINTCWPYHHSEMVSLQFPQL